jgi:gluconate 5-dehydrogenase
MEIECSLYRNDLAIQDRSREKPPVLTLFDLTGKTALVTGSSQGIGLALARGLGAAGARIVLNGRDETRLRTAYEQLAAEGVTVATARFDVTDSAQVGASIDEIEGRGPIDILVNCAGVQYRAPLEDLPEREWRRLIETNLDSVFFVAQAVARHMLKRGAGKIINICSVQSELGRPSIAAYAATKGAVKMLTKGMCADWGRRGLQINGLAPGYFKTDLTRPLVNDPAFSAWLTARTPAGRWGDVEELAGACIFLASRASDFVNGQILYVDGGLTSVV